MAHITTRTIAKKEAPKPNIQYMRERDRQPVRGKFIFHELPGGNMKFAYKAYKGDDVEVYDLLDGEVYSIPLGVARHLNNNCWYPIHSHTVDENGRPAQRIGQKVRRCSFQSLEFVDFDDLPTNPAQEIVTVENI